MPRRLVAAVLALSVCALTPIRAFVPADGDAVPADSAMLRVFLKDGSSLTSYGEPARVGDRIVFSMPTTPAGAELQLHLVNLAADRVDWDRTARYADAARAARYLATEAGYDYAELSNDVAQALNQVAVTADPAARAAIIEHVKTILADWPPKHYGYKQAEVLQMIGMLDQTIAGLRATPGMEGFSLSFVATTTPPPPLEPLLPPSSPKEAIDQVLLAAKLVEEPAERTSLLTVASSGLERDRQQLPADWADATAAAVNAQIANERRTDGLYRRLIDRMLGLAKARTRNADVHGVERLMTQTERWDRIHGSQRPDVVKALLDSLGGELENARRLRLARDQWTLRARGYRQYRRSIALSVARLSRLKTALSEIKGLAGPSPDTLDRTERMATQIRETVAKIVPPDELAPTHALLVSAADLARNAASIRREAVEGGNLARAWDASAAAAGALMLTDRARTEIQTAMRLPQLLQPPK